MMDRRRFIQLSVTATTLGSLAASCHPKKKITGSIVGAGSGIGHLLRDQKFNQPTSVSKKKIVIAGAGVSGLAAAYFLQKNGEDDFVVLDLEKEAGGNSRYGSNEISAYPWGAHYVPIPNNDLTEYLAFLRESEVITGFDNKGLPVYNDFYLCFDPQERLYINGRWQEGLVPHFGVPDAEQKQIHDFLALMEQYRHQAGKDGKQAFAIPIDQSSNDENFVKLDSITMKEWMKENRFTSSYLHWYVNYCTRDDFGTPYESISAWMGIHYFASRKGVGANAEHQDVLTWQEGNGFLVNQLSKNIRERIQTGKLVVRVEQKAEGVLISYYDTKERLVKAIEADQCILAIPQFVIARVLNDDERKNKLDAHYQYMPWMVANLKVRQLKERSGVPLSWDNVIYDSPSLGYVEATHELIQQKTAKRNLTFYLPLTDQPPKQARVAAYKKSYEDWVNIIMDELRIVHPDIAISTEELNVMLWGHAMVQPVPGMIHGTIRKELAASMGNIHFAHTDLAGASIFEEAFYQGLNAAKKVLSKTISYA